MGLFSSKGKSGAKERHKANAMMDSAYSEFNTPQNNFNSAFAEYLSGAYGGSPSDALGAGQNALFNLLSGIERGASVLTDPSSEMPFGLSAPGILDNIIARSQEATQHQAQTSARAAADMMPAIGGGSARAIKDIYAGAAGNQANIETQLRAEAAQQDLTNRINWLTGMGQAASGVSAGMQGAMNPTMGMLDFLMGLAGQRAGITTGKANQYYDLSKQKREARDASNMAIGSWFGQQIPTPMNGLNALGGVGGIKSIMPLFP